MYSICAKALRLSALFVLFTLTACGGGGGDGGGGGGSGGGQPGFSVAPGSLSFNAASTSAMAPVPQTITVTIFGGTVFLGAFFNGPAIASAMFNITGQTTGVVTVFPATPSTLGVGTHSGTITIVGCNDANCNSQVSGSPKTVNVTYLVAGISASPSSVNLDSLLNTASAAVPVTVSTNANSSAWSSSISYLSGAPGWLTLNPSSGASLPATINFGGAALPVGTYTANVTITAGALTQTIPVTYVVNKALNPSPTSLIYTIGNSPAPADLTRQVSVGAFAGVTWTAASNVPWLSVSPTSGGTGGTVNASIVQAQLNTMTNGTYNGMVTLTPSVGSIETISVTLTISRTQVNYVAPYVATSGTSKEVIVRGEGFSQVVVQNVKFNSTNATSFTVVSDTEIRATHPNLSAGSYSVQLENNLGVNQSLATLVVLDAPSYSAASIAYPNAVAKQVLDIAYDAERQALVVAVAYPTPGSSGDIFRYPFSASAWATSPTTQFIPSFRGIGLSTDGQKLIALSGLSVVPVDPISLATGTSTSASAFSASYLSHVVSTSDGYAFITSGFNGSGSTPAFRYNVRNPGITAVGSFLNFHFGSPGASANGDHITVIQGGGLSPAPDVYRFDATDASIVTTGLTRNQNFLIPPVLDRAPSRIVMDGFAVYNTSYTLVGSLPFVSLGTQSAVALSPDGTRAYSYVSGTTLHTYDLTAAPVGGIFPEIGTGTPLPSDPGVSPKMTLSQDGGTLFIAGGSGIVVVPAP